MTPTTTPLTVLIAAHDADSRAVLSEMLQTIRPGIEAIEFGREGESQQRPDMAMVVENPGEQLGRLAADVRERHGDIGLVMIAPRFDEGTIEAAANALATAIVVSPCEPAALLRVIKAHERRVVFSGRVSGIATAELLRLHAAAGGDGVLHITRGEQSGALHLESGQPIHAHCGSLRGPEAVCELLSWSDARASWIAGRSASPRTILGRLEGLLERESGELEVVEEVGSAASRDVLEKLERLSQTPDILAAYLLRNTEVVTGRCEPGFDDAVVGRALSRLAQVFHDVEAQQGDSAGSEIQATIGEHRLVVDRLGPSRLGFQVGVVVRQATPVCKSLRRLLRQIDRSFRKTLMKSGGAKAPAPSVEPDYSRGLHRVA